MLLVKHGLHAGLPLGGGEYFHAACSSLEI